MADIRTCAHTKDDGSPCEAIPVKNTQYCYFHRKFYQPAALPGERSYQSPLLESNEAITLAATHLYQSFLTGRIPLREAQFALNILRLASKTVAAIERKKREEAKEERSGAPKKAASGSGAGAPPDGQECPPHTEKSSHTETRKPLQTASAPAYKGERIVDPYGCLAHLK